MRTNLALELKNTTNILKEQPALETLQSQEEIWQQRHLQLTEWLNMLTSRTAKLQVVLTQLKKLQEVWSRTRDAEEAANAPDPIPQQINCTLAAIQAAQQPYRMQRDELLKLQSSVAEALATCNTALAQIGALQQMAVGGPGNSVRLLTPAAIHTLFCAGSVGSCSTSCFIRRPGGTPVGDRFLCRGFMWAIRARWRCSRSRLTAPSQATLDGIRARRWRRRRLARMRLRGFSICYLNCENEVAG